MAEKKTILVIDDDPDNLYLLKESLQNEGYKVNTADNGRKGIEIAVNENPDLILCDIMMPDVDGYRVLEEIKKDSAASLIPFIFLTAKSGKTDIRIGMQKGADDYITKPIFTEDLLSSVKIRLEKKELFEKIVNNLRSSISYSLPHELQTPLTGILGFSEILIDEYRNLEREHIKALAENIRSSAERLNKLVQKVLLAARLNFLSADKLKHLRSESTRLTRNIITNAAIKNAEEYDRTSDLFMEIADAELAISGYNLKIIAEEVIENSFKYSAAGSAVRIAGRHSDNYYELTITDSGIGMNSQQISMIGDFMQFNRMIFEQQGTGLGLSIVKKLAKIHKGKINIKSEQGKGTTVKISLPVII